MACHIPRSSLAGPGSPAQCLAGGNRGGHMAATRAWRRASPGGAREAGCLHHRHLMSQARSVLSPIATCRLPRLTPDSLQGPPAAAPAAAATWRHRAARARGLARTLGLPLEVRCLLPARPLPAAQPARPYGSSDFPIESEILPKPHRQTDRQTDRQTETELSQASMKSLMFRRFCRRFPCVLIWTSSSSSSPQ